MCRGLGTGATEASPPLTASGTIIGTVDYLAPEQAGQSAKAEARSDVYSLGCVLFFLLLGRPPFDQGTIWDRLDAHRKTPAPGVRFLRPDIPASLAALVARMLAKPPTDRPESMDAVVSALDAISGERSTAVLRARHRTEAQPATLPGAKRLPRRSLLWVGVAAGLLPVTGFAITRAFSRKEVPDEPEQPPTKPPQTRGAPPIAEMPYANAKEYQQRWADHLGLPVERTETVGAVSFRFVLIPPGTFRMGSPAEFIARLVERPELDNWTKSIHRAEKERLVTIRRPFYLGKTEGTHEQFELFVSRTAHRTLAEKAGTGRGYFGPEEKWELGPGFNWRSAGQYLPTADHPVINVGWSDATAFCKWLSTETGANCRVPAESEWEFACRGAGTGTGATATTPRR